MPIELWHFSQHPEVNLIATSGVVIDASGEVIAEKSTSDSLETDVKKSIRLGYPGVSPVGQALRREIFDFLGHCQ